MVEVRAGAGGGFGRERKWGGSFEGLERSFRCFVRRKDEEHPCYTKPAEMTPVESIDRFSRTTECNLNPDRRTERQTDRRRQGGRRTGTEAERNSYTQLHRWNRSEKKVQCSSIMLQCIGLTFFVVPNEREIKDENLSCYLSSRLYRGRRANQKSQQLPTVSSFLNFNVPLTA